MDTQPDLLPSQCDLFALPADVTYLNCAAMGPQLRAVGEAGLAAVALQQKPWQLTDWFGGAESLRCSVARLLHVDADGIALIPSASYGLAIAAHNVVVKRGQNIVMLEAQFPSNVYVWRDLADRQGANIRVVRKADCDAWTDAVLQAIDDDTAVVAVPNCHWTDGALVDLVRVGQRAREVSAALVVDASQSLGALPIDIDRVQPDFMVSVGYKWLMGPYSLGYLYASPKWRECGRPLEASWATRASAEDFTRLVDYTDEYRPGARRFDMGEYSQFILAPMALAAINQLQEWRIDRIQATLSRLTDLLAGQLVELGAAILPRQNRVGHILGIRFPGGIPQGLHEQLTQQRIHLSVRGTAIRVAPHLYNDVRDIERFVAVLRDSLTKSRPKNHP